MKYFAKREYWNSNISGEEEEFEEVEEEDEKEKSHDIEEGESMEEGRLEENMGKAGD